MRKISSKDFQNLILQFTKVTKLMALALIFSSFAACQNTPTNQTIEQKKTTEQQITDGFYRLSSNEPVKLNVPLKEIFRTNQTQITNKSTIEKYVGSRRKFINAELNSRLPVSLKNGDWRIKWQTQLPQSFTTSAVLETSNHIVLQCDGVWFLFDENGKKIKNGQLGASGSVLDDESFYAADESGMIWARNLSDGADIFGLSLYFGDAFERIFMLRKGQKFLVVSTERELDPDKPDKIENSLFELVDLGNTIKTDGDRRLTSSKPLAHLVRKTKLLLTAAHNETLVFATQNRVYQSNLNLEIEHALTANFTPLTMSLDDLGRIYLVVKQKNGYFLWMVYPTGELTIAMELPTTFAPTSTPPIIGYDYNIYLLGAKSILAITPDGKTIWQSDLEKKISGGVITANDQLLVSAENELLAFDQKGQKSRIFTVSDDIISSPPILTANGEILLAAKKYLYCLSAN